MTFLMEGQSGSVVLYFLQSGYLFRGNTIQEGIAVVNSRKDVCSNAKTPLAELEKCRKRWDSHFE